ncbi:hypothetical protein I4U23_022085 [Adineta vaga]|nr:hypothetical protein I4U23_022085 [Adineta vaga]
MVTDSIIRLFDGYNFRKTGNRYTCLFCYDFSIGALKKLLTHMEKFHSDEFLQLVQERRDVIDVLDAAIMNISNEMDENGSHVDGQSISISNSSSNIVRQSTTTTMDNLFSLSSSSMDRNTRLNVENNDLAFKAAVHELHTKFQQGQIDSSQLVAQIQQLQIRFQK